MADVPKPEKLSDVVLSFADQAASASNEVVIPQRLMDEATKALSSMKSTARESKTLVDGVGITAKQNPDIWIKSEGPGMGSVMFEADVTDASGVNRMADVVIARLPQCKLPDNSFREKYYLGAIAKAGTNQPTYLKPFEVPQKIALTGLPPCEVDQTKK